ncbi:hypothetical protein KKG31_00605 [Patescibacteria group bacterium]|nr:hypothetical protein [Patescibacteria group bacterium]
MASFLILGLGSTVLASCEEIDFGSKSVCVDLIKVNNSTYELDIDHSDYSSYTTNAYYYVLLPNKEKNKRSSG